MANWKTRERKPGQMVDKQNKRIKSSITQSASYGSMTFWKNVDFWQSMLLYAILISLLFVLAYVASLLQ